MQLFAPLFLHFLRVKFTNGFFWVKYVDKVDGTLMPPDGPESWPKNNSRHQWLVFYRINGMSLEGNGLIDGRGEKWWDLPCKPHKVLINFNVCVIFSTI